MRMEPSWWESCPDKKGHQSFLSLLCEHTVRRIICWPGRGHSQRTKSYSTLILDFQTPRSAKMNVCYLSHPVSGVLLIVAWADRYTTLSMFQSQERKTDASGMEESHPSCDCEISTCIPTGHKHLFTWIVGWTTELSSNREISSSFALTPAFPPAQFHRVISNSPFCLFSVLP